MNRYLTNVFFAFNGRYVIGLRLDGVYDFMGVQTVIPGTRFPYGQDVEPDHPPP